MSQLNVIKEDQVLNDLSKLLTEKLEIPALVTKDNMSIRVFEEHMAEKKNFKCKFSTSNLESFKKYLETYWDNDNSILLIDPDSQVSKSILDHGTPSGAKHQFHTAKVYLEPTSKYGLVLSKEHKNLDHDDLIDFLEELGDESVRYFSAGEEISYSKALAGVRAMTVEKVTQSTRERDDMSLAKSESEKIEAKSKLQFPDTIILTDVCYHGLEVEQDVSFRIKMVVSNNQIYFKRKILNELTLKDNLKDSFKGVFDNLSFINEDSKIYVGLID